MNTKKIHQIEINNSAIAYLPDKPTASKEYGGLGMSAQNLKVAFDKLPMLAVERINSLIADIESDGQGRIGESIKTGIRSGHTLADFFIDLVNGSLASYLTVGTSTLIDKIASLEEEIAQIKSKLEE
jgi:hypothetical protein